MSFSLAANRLMSVAFRDDAGDVVTDFAIQPTSRTQALMADYGILFREITGGMALYYTTNPYATPPLTAAIADQVRFSFAMRPAGSDPALRYDGLSGPDGTHVLLDNLDGAGATLSGGSISAAGEVGAGDHVFAGPRVYPVEIDLSGGAPNAVEAVDRFDNSVAARTVVNDATASPPVAPPPGATAIVATLDVPKQSVGALRLVTPAPGTLNHLIYADDDVVATRAIGIIDLYWTGPQSTAPANTGIEYTAAFRRRQ